jgi:hypothetical protein
MVFTLATVRRVSNTVVVEARTRGSQPLEMLAFWRVRDRAWESVFIGG